MRIISLKPAITDTVVRLSPPSDLVGVTHLCGVPAEFTKAVVLTKAPSAATSYPDADSHRLARGLCEYHLSIDELVARNPELILTEVRDPEGDEFTRWAEARLSKLTGRRVLIKSLAAADLSGVYNLIEEVGAALGQRAEARKLAGTIKAQVLSWGDSFFNRCRGKRVVVLSGLEPLKVEQGWIADLVKLVGARPIELPSERQGSEITWSDVTASRPDVIVVAPLGFKLTESVKTFSKVVALPEWESLPAVKRGEVIFAAGDALYRPGPRLVKGAAVLISAIAGLDSGYITERDEYFKLRYLELHRHRFL